MKLIGEKLQHLNHDQMKKWLKTLIVVKLSKICNSGLVAVIFTLTLKQINEQTTNLCERNGVCLCLFMPRHECATLTTRDGRRHGNNYVIAFTLAQGMHRLLRKTRAGIILTEWQLVL